jgi:hypothetical protein
LSFSKFNPSPNYISSDASVSGNLTVSGNLVVLGTTAISGSGEANTASNLGAGTGIFAQKSVVDLQFKSLIAGSGMSITSNGTTITLSSSGSAASGTITGPASSTDMAIALWSGSAGTAIKNSNVTIDSSGNITQSNGSATFNGRNIANDGSKLDGLPTSAYATIASSSTALTQRGTLNFVTSGSYISISSSDSSPLNTTTIAITSSGEPNTASNLGAGTGIFAQKSGVDLQFKSLVAGSGISITSNGTTITLTSSGGATTTPGGASGSVQFNNGSTFGGSTGWTIDSSDSLKGTTVLKILSQSATPTSPTNNNTVNLYTKNYAGLNIPFYQNSASSGGATVENALQTSFLTHNIVAILPGGAATLTSIGTSTSLVTGGITNPAQTTTSFLAQSRRANFLSNAGTNNGAGVVSQPICWRGNSDGYGGFNLNIRFGCSTNLSGSRAFFGLSTPASFATVTANVTAGSTNFIGIGYEDNDAPTGNYFLLSRDNTTNTTKTDLGFPRNATDVYDLFLYAKPNSDTVGIRIVNVSSGTLLYDAATTTGSLPQNSVFLRATAAMSTGSGSVAVSLDLMKIYLESQS